MKGRPLISICNWTPPLSIHAIYFCWLRKDWNKWFKETWLGLQSNDPKIILTFDDKVHYFTKKKSEISTEWKFLKGRPPIYIFERACPALMHAHNSIKNQTEDIFKRHDVTHSEKDLTIRWWCNCIHCFMKRNRKYQLHDNPSVGGLEHTFASVRICSRINHTALLSGKPEWFGSIYDIPTRRLCSVRSKGRVLLVLLNTH